MAYSPMGSWGAEIERIRAGGLASSTEDRLARLRKWGGFTSFLTPRGLGVGADCGIEPIGQVVGLSTGLRLEGWVRTTQPGQGRPRPGAPRWRERTGPVRSWNAVRRQALDRLSQQAELLDADAVVAVTARRREAGEGLEPPSVQLVFTGTAVRMRGRRRSADEKPTLTMATPDELWRLLRAGIEPAGIAGAYASVETWASLSTVSTAMRRRVRSPNVELPDLTKSFYEARRLAFERLIADAKRLNADGLLGIDMVHQEHSGGRLPGLHIEVHLLATAIRRRQPAGTRPDPVLALGGAPRG
jgi:uncharacterized protein YbjQ (UPF0145 family)